MIVKFEKFIEAKMGSTISPERENTNSFGYFARVTSPINALFNVKINEWKDLNENILQDENIPNRLKEKLNAKLAIFIDVYNKDDVLIDQVKSLVILNKKASLPIIFDKSNIGKDYCLYTSL
jgi:hypothetical protein